MKAAVANRLPGEDPEQMPVDLRRQRRHIRCYRRQAPHQRLNVGGQQRGRHALAGHVSHHEERAIARQVDDIEVVAAHGTQRLVERVDFVTRDLVYRGWLQGLLNLLSRELLDSSSVLRISAEASVAFWMQKPM